MSGLRVTGLCAGYGDVDVLTDVELAVEPGEIVVVVGPNGAGKSTLMKAIFGLVEIHAGTVVFDGADIADARPERLVRAGLAYVPQERNVFPTLTVSENLDMGAFVRRDDTRAERDQVFDIFPDLRALAHRPAGELSGGQRQMVAIARALMIRPRLLVLDEPTVGLSPRFVDDIFARIRAINAAGIAVLMVEQNARRALEIATRGYVLVMGRNRFTDTGPALLANPDVASAFLGG